MTESLDQMIEVECMDLQLGLPSRCICEKRAPQRSAKRRYTECAFCGGLIETDQERAERPPVERED